MAPPVRFSPLADFHSEELGSTYCKGLTYTVREGNKRLAAAVEKWLAEKKVELVTDAPQPAARIGGKGTVK